MTKQLTHEAKRHLLIGVSKLSVLMGLLSLIGLTVVVRIETGSAGLLSIAGAIACFGVPVAYTDLRLWIQNLRGRK